MVTQSLSHTVLTDHNGIDFSVRTKMLRDPCLTPLELDFLSSRFDVKVEIPM